MATKKEKLIEEAQRFALRGQVEKAISSYRALLAMEPNATNHRQKLAEILVKSGKLEDARVEFETIGKHYASNGFYLKAIAIYKQIQKLFPADISISLTMASLNEKHGLTANALAEYKSVADYYEKNGQPTDVLKILEKMQGVDQTNVNVKLKLAEAYFQADRLDESYKTFGKIATILQERGENNACAKLNLRIQKLFPQKSSFMLEVLEEQILSGHAASAISGLQELLRINPNDKRVWELVITSYTALNQPQRLKSAYTHYLKFFPQDSSPQIGLIGCLASQGDLKGALELLKHHESDLLKSGQFSSVIEKYLQLEEMDPINLQILEGLERSYLAAGNQEELKRLAPKIKSLKNLAAESDPASINVIEPPVESNIDNTIDDLAQGTLLEIEKTSDTNNQSSFDEEIEIEIDFDDVSGFAETPPETLEQAVNDNWLDPLDGIMGTVSTAPSGVKFGNNNEAADSQSHYDLGVAFKEMGLYDDAINELNQAAAVDSKIKIPCLLLQATCLREKGDPSTAENFLRKLLKQTLKPEDYCQAKYELALTCSAVGKQEESAQLLSEIETRNPGFRNVRTLLDTTDIGESGLDFSDDELKGFELK